ncbi:hypothetical protein D3C77_598390 [compost metagenome]
MVGGGQPLDTDRRRQPVARHLIARAQRIALALQDQRRRAQLGQVFHAGFLRLAGGVEGIAQANQRVGPQLIGQHACHACAHRLAANGQRARDLLPHPGIHPPPMIE